jgi:hypothetical protein
MPTARRAWLIGLVGAGRCGGQGRVGRQRLRRAELDEGQSEVELLVWHSWSRRAARQSGDSLAHLGDSRSWM